MLSIVLQFLPYIGLARLSWKLGGVSFVLGIVIFIMLHIARFSYTGQVCSGVEGNDGMVGFGNLEKRGRLFLGLIITGWVIMSCCCCCVIGFTAILLKNQQR